MCIFLLGQPIYILLGHAPSLIMAFREAFTLKWLGRVLNRDSILKKHCRFGRLQNQSDRWLTEPGDALKQKKLSRRKRQVSNGLAFLLSALWISAMYGRHFKPQIFTDITMSAKRSYDPNIWKKSQVLTTSTFTWYSQCICIATQSRKVAYFDCSAEVLSLMSSLWH